MHRAHCRYADPCTYRILRGRYVPCMGLATDRLRDRRVATAAVLGGLVLAAFEGTVVTSAMPTIVHDLGGLDGYGWVFSSFLMTSTLAVLVSGRLADRLGRLPVFLGGMALFLVGSALCGTSASFGALVAFRAVQGLGAGALQPVAMTITADLYTLDERARIQGLFTGAWGTASVLGPVIGGWVVLHASWRWVFLVNVPVGLVAAALLLASYRDPPRVRAAQPFAAVAGAPAVRAGLVASVYAGGILYACASYVPLWVAGRSSGDALEAGAALVPLLVGWAFGSSFGVRVLVARGMRTSVVGGFVIAAMGAVALAACASGALPPGGSMAALAVLGLGLGPAASTSLVGAQSCVPWGHRGAITSAVYAARSLGGALVVTALGSVVGTPQDAGAARFAMVAFFALSAVATAATLAPRVLRKAASERDVEELEPVSAPAE
jgi:predicted MFS family arabinose efflux permease